MAPTYVTGDTLEVTPIDVVSITPGKVYLFDIGSCNYRLVRRVREVCEGKAILSCDGYDPNHPEKHYYQDQAFNLSDINGVWAISMLHRSFGANMGML